MYLKYLKIKNHPILKDLKLDLINPKTKEPYSVVAFVGENGCGKTTLLNEIFNYNDSKYIQDKQISNEPLKVLYLRQGSLHKNAMKEVGKLIDGKDMYPVNSVTSENGSNSFSLVDNNGINRTEKGTEILKALGDSEITTIFEKNQLGKVYCSQEISKKIDGKEHGYNISEYSSGQQEILLKLKDLKNMAPGTDCVLLDEPETSLHPRWQKEILNIMEALLETGGMVPQIFLATHSEKVLESLIKKEDVLIIRLFKDDDRIKSENVYQMDLCLPIPTFAEVDYIVFHMPTFDYHDQLFNHYLYLINKNTTLAADERILKYIERKYKFDVEKYKKARVYSVYGKPYATNTLPTYIRDYFHHPNKIEPPSEEELVLSIELMRKILKSGNDIARKE